MIANSAIIKPSASNAFIARKTLVGRYRQASG
jgi:hypothetical protein